MESFTYFFDLGRFVLLHDVGCQAHVMGHCHARLDTHLATAAPGVLLISPEKAIDPVCHTNVAAVKPKSTIHNGGVIHGRFERGYSAVSAWGPGPWRVLPRRCPRSSWRVCQRSLRVGHDE